MKKINIFSFGLVCFWMLFGVDLPLDSNEDISQLISFDEDNNLGPNCLKSWKRDDKKDKRIIWVISVISEKVRTK